MLFHRELFFSRMVALGAGLWLGLMGGSAEDLSDNFLPILRQPGLFKSLTEPPCSYVSTEHRKGFVRYDDPAIAWIRGPHNGGAVPLRHFLNGPRIINDTYGLFFYDPDAGFISVFEKDYGYEFEGWRNGIMIARGPDGTLYSTLSGRGIDGPKKGERLKRVPSVPTEWGHWLMLHPESTAYNLFDGKKYLVAELGTKPNPSFLKAVGTSDDRMPAEALVMGVEKGAGRAYSLVTDRERLVYNDTIEGTNIAVFFYGPTGSGVTFESTVDDRALTFRADEIAPETAPFMDNETNSRWTLAGRAVDGPLQGKELTWVDSIQCKWVAWANEYPETEIFEN
jgi:hypothetical protein